MNLRTLLRSIYIFLIILACQAYVFSQCLNTTKFPSEVNSGPAYSEVVKDISENNYAGDYFQITRMQNGRTYEFNTSADPKDWITIYDQSSSLIAEGLAPLSISGSFFTDTLDVHINTFPSCGTQNTSRATTIECKDCPSSNNVGIGVGSPDPSAILDISSSEQGLKLPGMTTFQRNAIVDPADGLIIYNTTLRTLNTFDDVAGWQRIESTSESSTEIITLSAYEFQPDRGNTSFITGSTGRMGDVSLTTEFVAPIRLPVGSKIQSIRYYYLDNFSGSTGYVVLKLIAQNLTNTFKTEHFLHDSNGESSSSNVKNTLITDSNELTISSSKGYYLSFKTSFNTGNSNLRIKGALITYKKP